MGPYDVHIVFLLVSGTCLAIEDALELARCLYDGQVHERKEYFLEMYSQRRRERAVFVQALSRLGRFIYSVVSHYLLSHPFLCETIVDLKGHRCLG